LFRLGGKSDNKHCPLLVELGSEVDKQSLLSAAPVYVYPMNSSRCIATDMTKLERERHKKVVAELKRQRSSGESNLTIRNSVVVSHHPHAP